MKLDGRGAVCQVMGLSKSRQSDPPRIVHYSWLRETKGLVSSPTLQSYLKATDQKGQWTSLFVSFRKPYAQVSTSSISRWLKEKLSLAGIKGYTGHSTHLSAVEDKGVPSSKQGAGQGSQLFANIYYKLSNIG